MIDPDNDVPDEIGAEAYRRRQRQRAVVMAWILGALVVLFFAVTIVKIQAGMGR